MPNSRKSGQTLRSKNRLRLTLRIGRESRTNSNSSYQIPARVIDATRGRAADLMREGAVAVEWEAKSGILDKSRRVAVIGIQVLRSVAKARSLDEGSRCSRSPWKQKQ